jgi:hypothetical protein
LDGGGPTGSSRPADRFDLVVSSLALHDVADDPAAVRALAQCLVPRGQ